VTGSKRLSQAISEGDGISVIATVDGPDAARTAERDGAEAVLVYSGNEASLEAVAAAVELPVLFFFDGQRVEAIRGADACVVQGNLDSLEHWHVTLAGEFELAIRVEDDDQLEEVLERFDPEIVVLGSGRGERLPHVLDLLSDVPAGKLAIAELEHVDQDAIDELERAGCDAVLFGAPAATG
jgi:indole-3-glycerol phosphate synthase